LDEANRDGVVAALAEVAEEARAVLDQSGVEVLHALDLRYAGQSYELTIEVPDPSSPLDAAPVFHATHEQRFAHADPTAALEVVNVRAIARAATETPIPVPPAGDGARPVARASVVIAGQTHDTAVYERDDFR